MHNPHLKIRITCFQPLIPFSQTFKTLTHTFQYSKIFNSSNYPS
jgi:hypothetical protein